MLQMEGQTTVAKGGAKRMSPERNRRYRANAQTKGRERHPGANVIWRRITDNIDQLVVRTGADPALASVLTRLVLFGHLSPAEGEIARYYAEIMRRHAKYNGELPHTIRGQNYEGRSPGSIDVVEREERQGTISEWERRAKRARKQHDRIERVLHPYMHGRDVLDDICLHEKEINASHYPSIRAMLRLIGDEFGITQGRHPGNNAARSKPKAKDIRLMVSGAIEAAENFAKRHKATPFAFTVGESKDKTRRGPRSFFLRVVCSQPNTETTMSPTIEIKTLDLVPSAVLAQILRACEHKGWKEIEK